MGDEKGSVSVSAFWHCQGKAGRCRYPAWLFSVLRDEVECLEGRAGVCTHSCEPASQPDISVSSTWTHVDRVSCVNQGNS